MKQARILIIGVIYNTYPETLRYLESLAPVIDDQTTVILVDNSNTPKPAGFPGQVNRYPFLSYIETGKNLGYFHAARLGLTSYLEQHPEYPQWVLVTNVDIVFSPDFFLQLNHLPGNPNLGVVAPSIISHRWNTDYNPKVTERYTLGKLKFYNFLYSSFLLHNLFLVAAYGKKWMSGVKQSNVARTATHPGKGRKIYAPHGSCLVFAGNYFTRGGTLDLPNFLFGEEILVAETALQTGLDIEYHPELVIHDHEHASTGFFVTPRMNTYNRQAIRAIIDRYYH